MKKIYIYSMLCLLSFLFMSCQTIDEKLETSKNTYVDEMEYDFTFTTKNFDDEAVSEDIFSGYDLTVINLWGTFCNPCIIEMPFLNAFYKKLPDNINLIGLCSDVIDGAKPGEDNFDIAQEITEKLELDYEQLKINAGLYENIATKNPVVPITFIVNRAGELVHEPIVGSIIDKESANDFLSIFDAYIQLEYEDFIEYFDFNEK